MKSRLEAEEISQKERVTQKELSQMQDIKKHTGGETNAQRQWEQRT